MAHALMKRVDTMSLGSLIEPPDQAAQAGIMSTQNPENSATPRTKNLMNAVAVVSQLLEGVENQKLSNEELSALLRLRCKLGSAIEGQTKRAPVKKGPPILDKQRSQANMVTTPTEAEVPTAAVATATVVHPKEDESCQPARKNTKVRVAASVAQVLSKTPKRREVVREVRQQQKAAAQELAMKKAREMESGTARCWVCDEIDQKDVLPVQCGCNDRRAHKKCLDEWINMLDGSSAASVCVACNSSFRF